MTEKKKILHLITGLEVGGAEMMLLKTLPKLRKDFDMRVCAIRGKGPIGEKLVSAGIPVEYLELRQPFDLRAIGRFRKLIREFQPNILVTYLIHADLFGRIFGRMFGVRTIICNQRGKLLQWEFLRIIDRLTKRLVTKYIVQTVTARKELMKKLHLPKTCFKIIPNTLDVKEFNFTLDETVKRKELGVDPNETALVCVSNLRRGKGHKYLLEAFEKLNKEQLKLLIVGEGEKKKSLLKQIKNYSSKENIIFLGKRSDVKEILKVSNIFILPTLGEGMSNAIMEAMATGLPVITTDIPENKELIENEKTGILVPAKDSKGIANAIAELIEAESKRKTLGENAKRVVQEEFDIDIVVLKMKKFFLDL